MNTSSDVDLSNISTIDALFERWQQERPGYKPFSNDGIIGDKAWLQSSRRIAFILKECNDDFVDIRKEPEYIPKKGNSNRFWRNLNIWSYVVTAFLDGDIPSLEQAKELKEQPVTGIAYINLKKNAECKGSSSYDPDIAEYTNRDWPFLVRQIEIINPEVLFFCGTFKFVRHKLDFIPVGERAFRAGDRIAVDFFHPSCRKAYASTFNALRDAVQAFAR